MCFLVNVISIRNLLTRTINFSLSVHSITKLISHPSECSFDNTAHKIISQDTINITRNVSLLINLEQPLGTY